MCKYTSILLRCVCSFPLRLTHSQVDILRNNCKRTVPLLVIDGYILTDCVWLQLEVCYRGGAVGGCDGNAGSILQLGACGTPPTKYQLWSLSADGALTQKGSGLCAAVPKHGSSAAGAPFDQHSIVADPLFVDQHPELSGNFDLKPGSPAFGLGFERIPKIEAPASRCGDDGLGCLAAFFSLQQQ